METYCRRVWRLSIRWSIYGYLLMTYGGRWVRLRHDAMILVDLSCAVLCRQAKCCGCHWKVGVGGVTGRGLCRLMMSLIVAAMVHVWSLKEVWTRRQETSQMPSVAWTIVVVNVQTEQQ